MTVTKAATIPTIASCRPTAPAPEHSATLAAQVPFLKNNNGAATKKVLLRHGFKEVEDSRYLAADGSWIQFNPARTAWERGFGKVLFRGLPVKLKDMASEDFDPAMHGGLALSPLGKLDRTLSAAGSRAKLTRAGFTEVLPGYFAHADGSFVTAFDGKLQCGYQQTRVLKAPLTGAKRPRPVSAKGGRYRKYSKLPSSQWAWYIDNTALGKLPILSNSPEDRRDLASRGFKSKKSGTTSRFVHPDGSWVEFRRDGRAVLGWQRWHLGQLPYNNRTPG
ncbi:MAG: hypothetical protein HY903_14575 [Deltaproteobacteria bacterium]|nr:hypothetical protein [Deltaproteobacteria bacterium]